MVTTQYSQKLFVTRVGVVKSNIDMLNMDYEASASGGGEGQG